MVNVLNNSSRIGRLVANAETTTKKNTIVTKFSIAVNSGSGEKKRTDYFDAVIFGNYGSVMGPMLTKGTEIACLGSDRVDKYEDKEGNKRVSHTFVVDSVRVTDSKETVEA